VSTSFIVGICPVDGGKASVYTLYTERIALSIVEQGAGMVDGGTAISVEFYLDDGSYRPLWRYDKWMVERHPNGIWA
jgi:hypothetical protein